MRNSSARQSATSLPASPHDETSERSKRYLMMMAVRVACFILMVVITPYGWYTWVLGAAAVFLPYIAVVMANVGPAPHHSSSESPERALPPASRPVADAAAPTIIRLSENRAVDAPTPQAAPTDPADQNGAA